jgi:hypothetical protein
MLLIRLPDGDLLVLNPTGSAIRIRPNGSTVPPTHVRVGPFLDVGPWSENLYQLRCSVLSGGTRRKRDRLAATSPLQGQTVAAASRPTLTS